MVGAADSEQNQHASLDLAGYSPVHTDRRSGNTLDDGAHDRPPTREILTWMEEIHRLNLAMRVQDLHAAKTCARRVPPEVAHLLKLALIGTHGVGKTTLAYEICSLLKKADHNVELVTEVVRRTPFPANEGSTVEDQLWILHTQIARELDASSRAEHLICDRSVLDNYCYLVS